jgi:hypothetical protein
MCLDVARAILNDPSGATAAQICAPVLANAPRYHHDSDIQRLDRDLQGPTD